MSAVLLVVEWLAIAAIPLLAIAGVRTDPIWLVVAVIALAVAGLARSIASLRTRRLDARRLLAHRVADPAAHPVAKGDFA